jgi:hypothetical protein
MSNFYLNMKSGNQKTGMMPVSTSHRGTCPDACPFKSKGCYAKSGPLAFHWSKVTAGERGSEWKEFLSKVREIPVGALWRHNQAGDLVGKNNRINAVALRSLTLANKGKRGYSYTHYPLTSANVKALRAANDNGFTVNVSTNHIGEVDKAMESGLPVVTVLPFGTEGRIIATEGGNKVLVCPATLGREITCQNCGLCQKRDRSFAIGFIAHGAGKKILGK